jgi:segregation and condensation protein B
MTEENPPPEKAEEHEGEALPPAPAAGEGAHAVANEEGASAAPAEPAAPTTDDEPAIAEAKSEAAEDGAAEAKSEAPEDAAEARSEAAEDAAADAKHADDDEQPTRELGPKHLAHLVEGEVPTDVDGAGLSDEPVPAEATEDQPEDAPPDPGSSDAASPRMQSIVESLLFAADKALTLRQLGDLLGENELAPVRAAVAAVEVHHQTRGFQLHQVAGGYQFRTNPDNAQWVQKLLAQKPVRLSRAQIETLAICAYRQPVTRPEIDEIRGVDSGGTLKTMLDRALIRIVGKKEEPGRPILYGTTKEFLEFFNLRDLKDLPTLREFHELSEEHRAQVAALEGVAPAGSIERDGEPAVPEAPPPLTRLEIVVPPEDEEELEEIDRLIRTAGVTTDQDQTVEPEPAPSDEFDQEPTREFDAIAGEPTRLHHSTLPEPVLERVDEEFDHSETTSKKKRPDGLDEPHSHDDSDENEEVR